MSSSIWRRAVVCSLALFALAPAAAHASTIVVTTTSDETTPGDEQCSLREAIASVNSPNSPSVDCAAPSATGNTIVLGAGLYTLSIKPAGADDNGTGDLNIAGSVGGLTIEGAGAGLTTLDATGLGDRILSIASGASVTVTGLTLSGGHAPAGADENTEGQTGGAGQDGGAIDNAGTLTLSGSIVTNDDAGAGGQGGPGGLGLGNTAINGGTGGVGGAGGGIYNTGTLTLDGSVLSNDDAGTGGQGGQGGGGAGLANPGGGAGGAGGQGGGLFNTGTVVIGDSTLTSDAAGTGGPGGPGPSDGFNGLGGGGGAGGSGGAIATSGPSLDLTDTTLSGDTAGDGGIGMVSVETNAPGGSGGCGGSGGAVANVGAGSVRIASSTFEHDRAGSGGAAGPGANGYGGQGGAGCAGGAGGAVSANAGSVTMTNSTLTADLAGAGGAGGSGGTSGIGGTGGGDGGNGGAGGGGGAIAVTARTATALIAVTAAGDGVGGGGAPGPGAPPSSAGTPGAAGTGGGIREVLTTCVLGQTCAAPTLQDSIVAGNSGGNCAGGVNDGGHNVTFGDASCPGANGDPKLGSLQDNGGPTETRALGAGSAAIDAVPATGAGCPATDQRGLPRPAGAACDAGAYEVTPPLAQTGPASAITGTDVTLTAIATANDGAATVQFEFGKTTAYDQSTPVQQVSGLTASAVTADLTGLSPDTRYHYRVVVTSADGTADGADASFTTAAVPAPTLPAPTLIGLKLAPSKFKPGAAGGPIGSRGHGGTNVSYSDTVAATTSFTVFRVRAKRACRAHAKSGPGRCTLVTRIGAFTHVDSAGRNSFRFTGRLGGHKLTPGSYLLSAVAVQAGSESKTVTVAFRVIR